MKTKRFIVVELEVEHNDDQDPNEVINESAYCFNSTIDGAEIVNMDIHDIYEDHPG